jgi:hypothetical protein
MMNNRSRLAGGLLALGLGTAGALAPTAAPAQTTLDTELHARMVSTANFPHAYGGARYESHHGWREFEINLNGIKKLAGKTVTVRVHGTIVGQMHVSQYGHAHLYRHNGLPSMTAGNAIRVRTKSGTLVSRGTFRGMHHHHGDGMM